MYSTLTNLHVRAEEAPQGHNEAIRSFGYFFFPWQEDEPLSSSLSLVRRRGDDEHGDVFRRQRPPEITKTQSRTQY